MNRPQPTHATPHRTRTTLLALLLATGVQAQSPDRSPAAERATFRVLEGFDVQLFASEDHGVRKPIQIRFDPEGRLWVAGSVVYPQLRPGEKPHDEIVVLEDLDGDGRADRSTVFADDLLMPTGLELGDGGVYVTSGNELLHLRDTDGDGRADRREVVFRGFGTGDTHQTINSFTWGPSGELMFSQGLHARSRVETPWGLAELRQAGVWRFWPRERRLEAFWNDAMGAHNPFGTVFDRRGQPFVFAGNGHGIYHLTPGMVATDHFLEQPSLWNQGRKFGGADFVGNSHWPPSHQGEVISGGYLQNTVERFRIRDAGSAGFDVERLPPLIESSDIAFRVVDVRFGPDGALYLCDWYNPVIGHYQASFRDPNRDRDRGRIWRVSARGRPAATPPRLSGLTETGLVARLGSRERWERQMAQRILAERPLPAVAAALRAALRTDPAPDLQFELLSALATSGSLAAGDLSWGARSPDAGVRAFAARVVGQEAGRPAGSDALPVATALAFLAELVEDPHPRVRLEAVVACSRVPAAEAVEVAARIARHPMEPSLNYAFTQCVHALEPHWRPAAEAGRLRFGGDAASEALFTAAAGGADAAARAARRLRRIAEVALEPDAIARLADTVAEAGNTEDLLTLLRPASFRRGDTHETAIQAAALQRAARATPRRGLFPGEAASKDLGPLLESDVALLRAAAAHLAGAWRVASLRDRVVALARAREASDGLRIDALAGVAGFADEPARTLLDAVAAGDAPDPVRAAAIARLAELEPGRAASRAAGWLAADREDTAVATVLTAFLQRADGTVALRSALAARPPAPRSAAAALNRIGVAGRRDPELARLLATAAGMEPSPAVITPADIPAIMESLRRGADPARGKVLFHSPALACTGCHSVDGTPGRVGPDLSALGTAQTPEFILGALLEPQREVKEGFMAWEIVTRDGTAYQGYLQGGTPESVAVADHLTGETIRIPVEAVAERNRLGSLMPDGLVDSLRSDELRDLVAYLSGLGRRSASP